MTAEQIVEEASKRVRENSKYNGFIIVTEQDKTELEICAVYADVKGNKYKIAEAIAHLMRDSKAVRALIASAVVTYNNLAEEKEPSETN